MVPASIMAYLHEKVVKVSWFEELCPGCRNIDGSLVPLGPTYMRQVPQR